ncbi:MAG: M20/M25/M40 family metallo-hydrolase [Caldilineaceae bacterium]
MQSVINQHLTTLCQEIGPRPIGSGQNRAAADYIQRVFKDAGLATERQEFPCVAWQLEEARLELDGVVLAATANTFSPAFDAAAPTVVLSTFGELENADLAQKIALLCGELATGPLAPLNSPIYLPDEHKKLGELLRAQSPLAVVMIAPEMGEPVAMIDDWTLPMPSVTVSAAVGRTMISQSGQPLKLTIRSQRGQGTSCNVIGHVDRQAQKRIVLCAHYDTKWGTPGAFDNGSGVAALLVLAEKLPRRVNGFDLEFITFSGEEYNGLGDAAYLQRFGLEPVRFGEMGDERPPALSHIQMAINIDGVGLISGTNTISLVHESAALQQSVAEALQHYPAISQVAPWPASNHYTFYSHGVPCIVLGNSGGADVVHRPIDTIEWVSAAKIEEVVRLIVELVAADE